MLWFKFILGLKVFELVSIIFAIAPDYGDEKFCTKTKFEQQHNTVYIWFFCGGVV